jgi:hypothetical protein
MGVSMRINRGFLPLIALLIAAWLPAEGRAQPIDISVQKVRASGPVFNIKITNVGPNIPPQFKLEFIDLVPPGMTLTLLGLPGGWTCMPGSGVPVVGPDVITCSIISPVGIPAGVSFNLVFKIQGDSQCQNCVRARLYRRNAAGVFVPVADPNPANNVACTQ